MAERPSFDLIVTAPDAHRVQVIRNQRRLSRDSQFASL
ncbi:hypothetical protein GGE65_007558 [Skermanella aerolata]|jgi:hypothetical protein